MKLLYKIELFCRSIKFFYQRLTRGWDDSDTWDLDYSLAKLILPRLERFKELTWGYPAHMTNEEWNDILDEMIWVFKWIISGYEGVETDEGYKLRQDQHDRAQAALDLFGKYYMALWW